ncbi:unnamed protein product [Clonostachys rosea f. rosea IK726]|uniref:Reverse transcriptase domain-containing protein n=2 Tax=Bionectria ochroleuca TaxID=29856 RepID=A0A0B7KH63_BIOOC|nr:unnamed protein product [Clonostachys rosea f. rosea IK726]
MATQTSALSQTLESITLTKIQELEKQRDKYETKKADILHEAGEYTDLRTRIASLIVGVREIYPECTSDRDVKNIHYWLNQSMHDVNVPDELLNNYEEVLRSKLEVPTRKFGLGHLYASLVKEWMAVSAREASPGAEEETFEVIDRQKQRLQELCDKFEKVVFEPLETDEAEIERYLVQLFARVDEAKGQESLEFLRDSIGNSCSIVFGAQAPFDTYVLKWCIKGLLAEHLISEEKQNLLRGFLDNEIVLSEMVDVLNTRFSDIETWEWQVGENGIPVLPRQQLNGKYRIWIDEDVLQALLVHYIGTKFCVNLKQTLTQFISNKSTWKWHIGPYPYTWDKTRRLYYLMDDVSPHGSIDTMRYSQYIEDFFTCALPSSEHTQSFGGYLDEAPDETEDDKKGGKGNVKQQLLRTLASEALLHRHLKGEVAMIQTDLEWYATGLSHSTIFSVMRFFGYSDKVINFFTKVLRPPLNVQSPEHPFGKGPRIRQRGVPMSHAIEKLFGELILFVMDFAVNQEDGLLVYRLHDDIWLCGEPTHCARGWQVMGNLAKVFGLSFNQQKTGSVYFTGSMKDPAVEQVLPTGEVRVGHLILDPATERWKIDYVQVSEHVAQLKKQLNACKSVMQWVQTWNSCMGRFFSHTFGEPAFCFGDGHVESILDTYREMQKALFNEGNATDIGVVEYLKGVIRDRFGVNDVPDAFIYLPEQFGGLGLTNPFVRLLEIREGLQESPPEKILQKILDEEKKEYLEFKKNFEEYRNFERRVHRCLLKATNKELKETSFNRLTAIEREYFMSFEEYSRFREVLSQPLATAYEKLTGVPDVIGPIFDDDVHKILRYGADKKLLGGDSKKREIGWALQLYADTLRRDYGGMRLVDKKHLPLGVATVMRGKAVKWTMIL